MANPNFKSQLNTVGNKIANLANHAQQYGIHSGHTEVALSATEIAQHAAYMAAYAKTMRKGGSYDAAEKAGQRALAKVGAALA